MKKIFLSLGFTVLLTFSCAKKQEGISLVDSNGFEKQMEDSASQIIDVRTPEEYAEGHIANAVNMNINNPNFETLIVSLNKEQPVMVYCKAGGRSAKAAGILKDNGFKQVYDLDGGIIGWNQANKAMDK